MDLNNLPMWSPWPARLLGLEPWEEVERTVEKVDQEYDKDKYARCLAHFVEADGAPSPEEIRRFQLCHRLSSATLYRLCVSRGKDLCLMAINSARYTFNNMLADTMRSEIEKSKTVVELGCGYGYYLWVLKQHYYHKHFLGADYSRNAVLLADHLFGEDPKINVVRFNFYDSDYEFLEGVEPPVTVFTAHAIEQLPDSTSFFEALSRHRDKIGAVFHFEPLYESHDNTLLGLMRQRYAQVNDYNRDLFSQLQRDHIDIVYIAANVMGLNPLNPTSVIHWEFKEVSNAKDGG